MLDKDIQIKHIKIKQEPDYVDNEYSLTLRKISPIAAEESNFYDTRDLISTLQVQVNALQSKVDSLQKIIEQQQETISKLRKQSYLLDQKNNDLEQELKSQKSINQSLNDIINQSLDQNKTMLRNEQTDRLTSHINETRIIIDNYAEKYADSIATFKIQLATVQQTESSHHQLLLSQYRSLENKVDQYKDAYNTHTHETTITAVGACADIAIRHGHAWGHTHTANITAPNPQI